MAAPSTPVPVGLSTASVYPEGAAAAFDIAAEFGYDGVEVMVWADPVSQNARALRALSEHHGIPILSIHAPTLLLTQRVMSQDPWGKIDGSIELAHAVGAPTETLADFRLLMQRLRIGRAKGRWVNWSWAPNPRDCATMAGLLDADGAAFIVHAAADDLQTDPSGNSGARITCGVFAPG